MEVDAMQKDDRLVVNMYQNHTLANLIRKAAWEVGEEAAYDKGHPLDQDSSLVVEGSDAKEGLLDAVDQAQEWLDELESEL
jgi:DNA-directed RNA polymerase subunit L